ncbi:MAG TPA: YceI family protein [Trueperaceae bacterium]|nr:YceI family protein [Trueperaceae bacterium]
MVALAALAVLACLATAVPASARAPGVRLPPASGVDPNRRAAALEPSSTITFHASDAFGGFDGKAPIAAFSLELDPSRLSGARGRVAVKSDAITTGNFLRDVNAARTVFDAARYPEIVYQVTAVQADPASLPDGRTADVTVTGLLHMHGVERSVVAHGRLTRSGDALEATLALPVRLSDFGMTRPRLFTVVVDDVVQVRVHLLLHIASP